MFIYVTKPIKPLTMFNSQQVFNSRHANDFNYVHPKSNNYLIFNNNDHFSTIKMFHLFTKAFCALLIKFQCFSVILLKLFLSSIFSNYFSDIFDFFNNTDLTLDFLFSRRQLHTVDTDMPTACHTVTPNTD